jgi:peptide-methionine (R)-S-oxide reductase
MMTGRRLVISTAASFVGASIARRRLASARRETFEVTHTEAEWRKFLTQDQFAGLRMTERSVAQPIASRQTSPAPTGPCVNRVALTFEPIAA